MAMNDKRLSWVMGALLLSLFLSSLDQTIVSTALPTIVEKLGGFEQISWVFTVYMLTSTAIMPIVGKLSDMYGRKRFYAAGLLTFIIGSALCGLAQDMTQLIVFRGIQGLGAGCMMPITFTLLFTLMPPERAGRFQAMFMGVFALSSIVGPSVGAFITTWMSWRWNFYINLPLGLIALFILMGALVESKDTTRKPKVDYAGAWWLVFTTVLTLLALKMGGVDYPWASWPILGLLAAGACGLALFLYTETKAEEPIVPFELFRNRTIAGSSLATFLQGMIMFGSLLYVPIFIQGGLGGDVGDAGNALTPMMFSVMIGMAISGFLMRFLSWRMSTLLSMLLAGSGAYIITLLPLDVNQWALRADMLLLGIGIGFLMPISQMAIMTNAPARYQGVASSTVTFFRSVGGVFGSAIMAAIVNRHMTSTIEREGATLGIPPEKLEAFTNPQVLLHAEGQVPEAVMTMLKHALGDAVHVGFWMLVGASLLGLIVSLFMGGARFDLEKHKQIQAAKQTQEAPSAG
ncbi:MDR family MFS transporter [Paenibacillus validus]|uniref:DHA2 family efflux MFS transporter permease subunit n=1 Tax=Paenibacillus validus TaxID=44253 RepID=A0A7X2ZFI4_9BACL|nr:MDR family MFS transporter [Paenibacillus validus]MUG73201.1 DHA2 family efflux MFS transporter permease subunit [Paenibacillus validus]